MTALYHLLSLVVPIAKKLHSLQALRPLPRLLCFILGTEEPYLVPLHERGSRQIGKEAMIGEHGPKHIDRQIGAGRCQLTDRDPRSGSDQCEDLSFLFRRNLIHMNPEILEELEILDDERMNLGIGPYPVEQTIVLATFDIQQETYKFTSSIPWSFDP